MSATSIRPVGIEIILGCLVRGHGSLGAQMVLDCGCGDGSYTKALAEHVAGVHAIESDPGSVANALTNLSLEIDASQVEVHEASLEEIPYEDGSFDAVVIGGGLDHLGDAAGDGWAAHEAAVAEAARVLSPGGVMVIITAGRRQLDQCYWHRALIPRAADEHAAHHAPIEVLLGMLSDHGLVPRGQYVPLHALALGSDYLEPIELGSASWPAHDPAWALATEEEREDARSVVGELFESSMLADFIEQNDTDRPRLGQVTIIDAHRPFSQGSS